MPAFWKINLRNQELLETIWLLSAWKSPKSEPSHFKKQKLRKPQSTFRTILISGKNTLNHWICQHEFIAGCITAWLSQSRRRSMPQKACSVISIFQTCAHFIMPLPLSDTAMDTETPLSATAGANLTGQGQSRHWRYSIHPGYINMQKTSSTLSAYRGCY